MLPHVALVVSKAQIWTHVLYLTNIPNTNLCGKNNLTYLCPLLIFFSLKFFILINFTILWAGIGRRTTLDFVQSIAGRENKWKNKKHRVKVTRWSRLFDELTCDFNLTQCKIWHFSRNHNVYVLAFHSIAVICIGRLRSWVCYHRTSFN